MGGLSALGALAADSSGAVNDQGFVRHDGQRDGEVAVGGFEDLRRGVPSRRSGPSVSVRHRSIHTCKRSASAPALPRRGPAELFRVLKPALLQVTHGKVREVQLGDGPFRGQCLDLIRRDSAAKERELIAKGAAVFRREVPRVVPPFGAECIVRAVVARKLVAISFSCLSEGTVCPPTRWERDRGRRRGAAIVVRKSSQRFRVRGCCAYNMRRLKVTNRQ